MTHKSAFPVFDSRNAGQDYECADAGMTLRDYFAAKAMQSLLIASHGAAYQHIATDAYMMADAMMKERGEA